MKLLSEEECEHTFAVESGIRYPRTTKYTKLYSNIQLFDCIFSQLRSDGILINWIKVKLDAIINPKSILADFLISK